MDNQPELFHFSYLNISHGWHSGNLWPLNLWSFFFSGSFVPQSVVVCWHLPEKLEDGDKDLLGSAKCLLSSASLHHRSRGSNHFEKIDFWFWNSVKHPFFSCFLLLSLFEDHYHSHCAIFWKIPPHIQPLVMIIELINLLLPWNSNLVFFVPYYRALVIFHTLLCSHLVYSWHSVLFFTILLHSSKKNHNFITFCPFVFCMNSVHFFQFLQFVLC